MTSDERKTPRRQPDDSAAPTDLAGLWAKYGNKVLIGLTAILLVVWAVRYRHAQAVNRQEETRANLAGAWVALEQVSRFASLPASPDVDKQAAALESQINQTVESVLADPDIAPAQAAWAWLARGEMYWALAHRPAAEAATPSTQATTAPTSQPTSQPAIKAGNDSLTLAAGAYETIVNKFASETTALTIARYGLAAIAEERGDLAAARAQYKALIESPNFTDGTKPADSTAVIPTMAESRLKLLGNLEKPTLLLPATQPVALPTTARPGADLLQSLTGPSGPPIPPTSVGPAATQPTTVSPIAPPATRP